jgi:hypothetical protein
MKIDFKGGEEIPTPLEDVVEPDTDLKNWLVEYVGEKKEPENGEVTIGMIVDVVAEEFPDFVLALAEENWIRGYHQAFEDIEAGEKQLAKATGRT